ncbi:neprilysin-like [Eurosta solidaginis]|uniref:neprilysin-like n=1 Tax=Eurosta solidaginis TaxID=178769 RepID=UPI003531593F
MFRFIKLPLHLLTVLYCIFTLHFCVHWIAGDRNVNNRERDEHIIRNAKATEVLKYMNSSADPCNNFYDYACGKWQEHQQHLQEGDAPISMETQLVQRVRKDVQMLLNAATRTKKPTMNERKIKEFYKSCLTVERSSELQQAFLMNFIKEYHGMPLLAATKWSIHYDWVEVIARLRLNYGFDFLIGMDVDDKAHPTLPGRAVIFLTEPKITLIPRHLCSAGSVVDVEEREQVSAQLQAEVSKDLQAWFSLKEDETERVAGDIIRFEFDLCRFMREEESVPPPPPSAKVDKPERIVYEGRNLVYLSKKFDNIINFRKYLENSLNSSISNMDIVMQAPHYFHNLARLVQLNPLPTLTNYIMYRALSVINLPRNETRNPRAGYCAELVMRYFPKVIGEMYKNKYQRSDIRSDVEQLFVAIKEKLRDALNIVGLPDNARNAFRNKLMLHESLLFPDNKNVKLLDLPLEHTNFWHKQDIAMKYIGYIERQRFYGGDPELDEGIVQAHDIHMKLVANGLITGWGILQPPFYDYLYSNSLKYALIGQRIARELIDAVMPNTQENPITQDDLVVEVFNNISECYRIQFSNYLHNIPNRFYNVTKLHQLQLDSAGLNVAFSAYLAWLDSVDPSNMPILLRETLPGVDFTNTQLFFLGFAQSRCYAEFMEETPPLYLPLDTHTEELYKVIGVLANNVEFAREFGCAPGTEMNPDDKCKLY